VRAVVFVDDVPRSGQTPADEPESLDDGRGGAERIYWKA
jgi:hypothetical protein